MGILEAMILVTFLFYVLFGSAVLAVLDDKVDGRLMEWADSAPLEVLKVLLIVSWPIVVGVYLLTAKGSGSRP